MRLPRNLPDTGEPRYLRLAQLLTDAIAAGVFRQGKRLPRTGALGRRYGLTSDSVQAAIAHLAERGIVRKGPGGRAYVVGER